MQLMTGVQTHGNEAAGSATGLHPAATLLSLRRELEMKI